jgi:hypothetical protein
MRVFSGVKKDSGFHSGNLSVRHVQIAPSKAPAPAI